MKPIVSLFYRESSLSKDSTFPVSVTVKFNDSSPLMYITGVRLTIAQKKAIKKNTQDAEALTNIAKINTAYNRMNAIAEIIHPYTPDVFGYITKEARKEKEDIFYAQEDQNFDPYSLAFQFLEKYKRNHPGAIIPELIAPAQSVTVATPVNNSVEKVQATLLTNQISASILSNPQVHAANPHISATSNTGNNTGTVNVFIQNLHVNGNGQLATQDPSRLLANPGGNVLDWMMETMDKRNTKGTDVAYNCARQMIIRYFTLIEKIKIIDGKEYLAFSDITVEDLELQEEFMLREGIITKKGETKPMAVSTLRTYLCSLKSAYNLAEKKKIITEDLNPFGQHKYILPEPGEQDRSLTQIELKKILSYTPAPPPNYRLKGKEGKNAPPLIRMCEETARDFWIFSYLSNGINFSDFLKLKWNKIADNEFGYQRGKIKRKVKTYQDLMVTITPELEYLFDRYGTKDKSPDNLVFPVLTLPTPPKPLGEMTKQETLDWRKKEQEKIKRQVDNFTTQVNRYMRKIAKKLGFKTKKFTTYSARHTYANDALKTMKEYMVAKTLGHRGTKSLKKYNNREDVEAKQEVQKTLTKHISFKRKIGKVNKNKAA